MEVLLKLYPAKEKDVTEESKKVRRDRHWGKTSELRDINSLLTHQFVFPLTVGPCLGSKQFLSLFHRTESRVSFYCC